MDLSGDHKVKFFLHMRWDSELGAVIGSGGDCGKPGKTRH